MTTFADTTTASAALTSRHDVRAFTRKALAVLLPLGAVFIALTRFLLPYDTTDSTTALLAKVSAHQGSERLVLVLGTLGVFTILPAYFATARLIRRHSPRLAVAALCLAVPGYLGLSAILAEDQYALAVARHGNSAGAAHVLDAMNSGFFFAASGIAFVLGHILGTVLLGVALYRTRLVPRWAAIALIVAQPVHLIAAVALSSHPLDLVCWLATAAGFAAVAVRVWSTPDDGWDLPPAASSR